LNDILSFSQLKNWRGAFGTCDRQQLWCRSAHILERQEVSYATENPSSEVRTFERSQKKQGQEQNRWEAATNPGNKSFIMDM